MGNELEKSIFQTISYFDIFHFPLSSFEVWQNLWMGKNYRYQDVLFCLENSDYIKQRIASKNGLYFLPGRQELVWSRLRKYRMAEAKYKKAYRATKILAHLPFVRMVAVCNDLAYSNAGIESDIDLFIVARDKKIWTTRFFTTVVMHLLGWRPNKKTCRDKICLSFFVNEKKLNLQNLAMKLESQVPDVHFIYWLTQFVPVFDQSNFVYNDFFEANSWLNEFLPNRIKYQTVDRRLVKQNYLFTKLKKIAEFFLYFESCEFFLKSIQMMILPKYLKEIVNQDSRVVMNDNYLKFHPNDTRRHIAKEFNQIKD